METKILHKTITINAAPQAVWQVLLESPYIEEWYAEFSEGLKAETDWSLGSRLRVVSNDGWGMVGEIVENIPNKVLSVEYTGVIKDGVDDYESPEAVKWKGHRETYRLFETGEGTKLEIEFATFDEYYDSMSNMWDKALVKIKAFSEKI
jgi:uncharacterized protein YndB with AHSA1/START domain